MLRLLVYIRVYQIALKRISSAVFASINYILRKSNLCDEFISWCPIWRFTTFFGDPIWRPQLKNAGHHQSAPNAKMAFCRPQINALVREDNNKISDATRCNKQVVEIQILLSGWWNANVSWCLDVSRRRQVSCDTSGSTRSRSSRRFRRVSNKRSFHPIRLFVHFISALDSQSAISSSIDQRVWHIDCPIFSCPHCIHWVYYPHFWSLRLYHNVNICDQWLSSFHLPLP